MILSRRRFVQFSTAGATVWLSACRNTSSPESSAKQDQAKAAAVAAGFNLQVDIFGGFAMVFTTVGTFVAGSMKLPLESGCHTVPHKATLRLMEGEMQISDDTSGLPREGPGPEEDPYKYKWTVENETLLLEEGGTASHVQAPTLTPLSPNSTEELPPRTSPAGWNDWRHIPSPARHHKDAKLDPQWRSRLSGLFELKGVTFEVKEPSQECARVGRWFAKPIDPATDAGFLKPLTDTVLATATSTGDKVRFKLASSTEGNPKQIIVKPQNGKIVFALRMEPRSSTPFDYKYKSRIEHVSAFYDLVTPKIDCAKRLIPAYNGFPEEQNCTRTTGGGQDPGGYCPGGVFIEP